MGCLLLAGCGDGDDDGKNNLPADASVKDFCKGQRQVLQGHEALRRGEGGRRAARHPPRAIPADARHGFELVVELVTDADDRADLEKRYKKLTARQRKSVEKLDAYIEKAC